MEIPVIFNAVPNYVELLETPYSKAELENNPRIANSAHSPDGFTAAFRGAEFVFGSNPELLEYIESIPKASLRPGAAFYCPAMDPRLKNDGKKTQWVINQLRKQAAKSGQYMREMDFDSAPVAITMGELRKLREAGVKKGAN